MLLHVLRNAITELRLSRLVSADFERRICVLFGLTSVALEADLVYDMQNVSMEARRKSRGG